MKSSTIPAVRVEPELREQLERVLQSGESLSQFVEASVREGVNRRLAQAEFIARGLASLESAKRDGRFVSADEVIGGLEKKLAGAQARRTALGRSKR